MTFLRSDVLLKAIPLRSVSLPTCVLLTLVTLTSCGRVKEAPFASDNDVSPGACRDGSTVEGDVYLENADDVMGLAGISRVKGSVHVRDDVSDLRALSCLSEIEGNLEIYETKSLKNLDGLEHLATLGGDLVVGFSCHHDGTCIGNALLEEVSLPSLERAQGVRIGGGCGGEGGGRCGINHALSVIEFDELEELMHLTLSANPELSEVHLDELEELTQLTLMANPELSEFYLEKVRELEKVYIVSNDRLETWAINSLEKVVDLEIRHCGSLSKVVAEGKLEEARRVQLFQTGIVDLNWLTLRSVWQLNLSGNHQLASLDGLSRISSASEVSIDDNAVLPSLQGLDGLETVEHDLRVTQNPLLEDLSGLDKLESADRFFIESNLSLTSLRGLSSLRDLDSLNLIENPSLTTLDGMENLIDLHGIYAHDNDALVDLSGLSRSNVRSIRLIENDQLTSLDGLQIESTLSTIEIADNAAFASMEDLEGLTQVSGDLIIRRNPSLLSLDGLEQLEATRELIVQQNPALADLHALRSLESVTASLTLQDNPKLTDLQGLDSLAQVGSLFIIDNTGLESLDGLGALTVVESKLEIDGNAKLSSFAALGSLEEVGGNLNVWNNSTLPTCEVFRLAEQIGLGQNFGRGGNDDDATCAN